MGRIAKARPKVQRGKRLSVRLVPPQASDTLYGASTALAVENFPVSGLRIPVEFLHTLAAVKSCCAVVNRDLRRLDAVIAGAIVDAAEEVATGKHDAEFPVDVFQTGSGTSTNMNMNEVIATLAERHLEADLHVHPNDHVNMGQSSNDVFPTAIHVAAAVAIDRDVLPALRALEATLTQRSREFADLVKTGRTHLQDATPVTLGQEFSGYAAQVRASIERIEAALPGLLELPIGGTAVGTGVNTHRKFGSRVSEMLADRFNLSFREARNHFEAQSARDACVFLSGALRTTAISLTKIANDIRWMGSGPREGLGELKLPEVQPGSSIMPGKANPVICEMLLQVCAQVIGNDTAITHAGLLSNFELNVGMPLMAYNLLQSLHILTSGARIFEEKCVRGLRPNRERLQRGLERNLMVATRLAPVIGYDRATAIARKAHERDTTVRDIALEEGMDAKVLDELLDPRRMLRPE